MQLQIVRQGQQMTVDVSEAERIRFPTGMIGFEKATEFALLPDPEGGIQWLHATNEETVAFAVLDPFLIWPDYDVTVPDADAEALELSRPQDAQLLAIITPREDPSQITANLRAPIVINRRLRIGRQIILADTGYPLHAPILEALTMEMSGAGADAADDEMDQEASDRAAA